MATLPILLLSTKSVWGGAQKYVFDLATNLPKDKYSVTVLSGGNGPLITRLVAAGISVTTIPTLKRDVGFFAEIASAWAIFRAVRKLRPKIFHANGSKGATLGIIAAKLARPSVRTIWSTHGVPVMEDRPLWQRALILLSIYIARPFTSHVIAISARDEAVLREYHIASRRKTTLIPIALDIRGLTFLDRDMARLRIAEHTSANIEGLAIGVIAEYTKNKGLTYLLDALVALKARGLTPTTILIGWGDDEKKLRGAILQNGLSSQVYLLPSTGKDAELLKAFDVFALTSVKEGLPYTLLEAGAASLAVIATRVGGVPDIISNAHEGMLVEPKDVPAIANALEKVLRDEALRKSLGENLYTRVNALFSLESELRDTARCYDALAKR